MKERGRVFITSIKRHGCRDCIQCWYRCASEVSRLFSQAHKPLKHCSRTIIYIICIKLHSPCVAVEVRRWSLVSLLPLYIFKMKSTLLGVSVLLVLGVTVDATGVMYYTPSPAHSVTFNERSLIIDGQPTLMLSGAVRFYVYIHSTSFVMLVGCCRLFRCAHVWREHVCFTLRSLRVLYHVSAVLPPENSSPTPHPHHVCVLLFSSTYS